MNNQRALFEEWYVPYVKTLYLAAYGADTSKGIDGDYNSSFTRLAWAAWQARWNTKIGAKHENS